MKKYLLFAFLIIGAVFIKPLSVSACVCLIDNSSLPQKVAQNIKNASAVFSGKVIAVEYRKLSSEQAKERIKSNTNTNFFSENSNVEILTVKIEVIRWWKGYRSKEIILLTETYRNSKGFNSTTSCERDFRIGEKILFFVSGKDKYSLQNQTCSLTNSLEKSKEVLEVLGKGFATNTSKDSSK